MSLTISYITNRKDCRIEWAFDALAKQIRGPIHVLVIDRFGNGLARRDEVQEKFDSAFRSDVLEQQFGCTLEHRMPKPSVWAGEYRLTKEDWFSAGSVRNTSICLCTTSHLAFLDDLSVPLPGWLNAAYEAVEGNYVGCGAYHKARNLVVKDGLVESCDTPVGDSGVDDRLKRVTKDLSECDGGWLYGCSFVAPLEDLLEVGGFPEYCDGLGSEDYCLGIALRNAGKHLKFDRRMMTMESEELHFAEPPMKRTDKGVSPNDKSHAALRIAQGSKYFPNYYEGGIRALREHVLAGNPFPICQIPTNDWFDGQPLSEM